MITAVTKNTFLLFVFKLTFFDTMTNSLEIAADVEGDYDDNSNDSPLGHNKNSDDVVP